MFVKRCLQTSCGIWYLPFLMECKQAQGFDTQRLIHEWSFCTRSITRGVNIGYQDLWSSLHQNRKISNKAKCWKTAFYILTFYVVILHLYFNFNQNNFSNTYINWLLQKAKVYMFTIHQHTICCLCLYSNVAHWDAYNREPKHVGV